MSLFSYFIFVFFQRAQKAGYVVENLGFSSGSCGRRGAQYNLEIICFEKVPVFIKIAHICFEKDPWALAFDEEEEIHIQASAA